MDSWALRLFKKHAFSLKTIASRLAPTEKSANVERTLKAGHGITRGYRLISSID
jgi:hypothetical protein